MSNQSIRFVFAAILALVGLVLGLGGIWLIALGGSSFYLVQGIAFIAVAALFRARNPLVLWVYAVLLLLTLVWAVLEVGLDWWQLAPRGDLAVALGIILAIPWVARSVRAPRHNPVFRSGWAAVAVALAVSVGIALFAALTPSHDLAGNLPERSASGSHTPDQDAGKEWKAYGGTQAGQRYSTLDQITPENVGKLKVAWTFHTGDVRSKKDPVETTYEVTPLKIGSSVYLCTPHDLVFALDAETGKEKWRYDPKVGEPPAKTQHLTCRGLSYFDGTAVNGRRLPVQRRPRIASNACSSHGRRPPIDRAQRRDRQGLSRLRRPRWRRRSVANMPKSSRALLFDLAADDRPRI